MIRVRDTIDATSWKLVLIILERYYSNLSDILIQVSCFLDGLVELRAGTDVIRAERSDVTIATCLEKLSCLDGRLWDATG
jgi:hypothetical protein